MGSMSHLAGRFSRYDGRMFEDFRLEIPSGSPVGARHYAAGAPRANVTLILAHGAGAPQTHPFMTAFGRGLSGRGIDVVTFNFPYMEARRRAPDRAPVLESSFLAAIADVRARGRIGGQALFIGGKSMGGRMASHVAAHHASAAGSLGGLVFLGYPLHPPGRFEQRRDAHLLDIAAPMLFVQGSRDAFGTADEVRAVAETLHGRAEVLEVERGDHSFSVPKGSGRSQAEVLEWVQDHVAAWMTRT
jgi:predicted alpha/beta-hydrolase family hydrolase